MIRRTFRDPQPLGKPPVTFCSTITNRLIMQKLLSTLALCFFALAAFGQVSSQSGHSKEELQAMYVNYLQKEGYVPEIDSDGDVRFKKEGKTYFIAVDDRDLEFFRIVLANIWEIETEEEYLKVLIACDGATASTKVAKAHTVRSNVWISTEVFVATPEDFEGVFKRCLSAIGTCKDKFVEKMNE
jgi:hypothetical protein